jgi:hypothetical protein
MTLSVDLMLRGPRVSTPARTAAAWQGTLNQRRGADPQDLLRPYPFERMRMSPISTWVSKPEKDDPSISEQYRVDDFGCVEPTVPSEVAHLTTSTAVRRAESLSSRTTFRPHSKGDFLLTLQ